MRATLELATLLERSGRWPEAIEHFQQAIESETEVSGAEHMNVLRISVRLAEAYRNDGQIGKSIAMYAELLQMAERRLGERHPDTLTMKHK